MMKNELLRLFSGPIGRVVSRLAGPQLLVIIAVGVLVLWGYVKLTASQVRIVEAEHQVTTIENEQLKAMQAQLDRAVKQMAQYTRDRERRDQERERATAQISTHPDKVLDLRLPEPVVRVLRQPLGFEEK